MKLNSLTAAGFALGLLIALWCVQVGRHSAGAPPAAHASGLLTGP